jgi:hypothetical protein
MSGPGFSLSNSQRGGYKQDAGWGAATDFRVFGGDTGDRCPLTGLAASRILTLEGNTIGTERKLMRGTSKCAS